MTDAIVHQFPAGEAPPVYGTLTWYVKGCPAEERRTRMTKPLVAIQNESALVLSSTGEDGKDITLVIPELAWIDWQPPTDDVTA